MSTPVEVSAKSAVSLRLGQDSGLSSVDNALALLEEVQFNGSLRVSDAARKLGVATSTAHRLLSCLKQRGYVDQDHRRTYHPGPRLRAITQVNAHESLLRLARPPLEALSAAADETFHVCVLEGNSVRMLDGYQPANPAGALGLRVGWLLPANLTAVGLVLLADLPDESLDALYPIGVPHGRRKSQPDLRELRRRLILVRRHGWAWNDEDTERGVIAIAVPVRGESGMVVASIGIAASAGRKSSRAMQDYLPLLQRCSRSITNELALRHAAG